MVSYGFMGLLPLLEPELTMSIFGANELMPQEGQKSDQVCMVEVYKAFCGKWRHTSKFKNIFPIELHITPDL